MSEKEITWRGTENLPVPILGLATTRELLEELGVRADRQYDKVDRLTGSYDRGILFELSSLSSQALAGLSDDLLNYRTVDE